VPIFAAASKRHREPVRIGHGISARPEPALPATQGLVNKKSTSIKSFENCLMTEHVCPMVPSFPEGTNQQIH